MRKYYSILSYGKELKRLKRIEKKSQNLAKKRIKKNEKILRKIIGEYNG